ncbi:Neprilysin-2-like protein, partial [Dinothrombium tinctorium]
MNFLFMKKFISDAGMAEIRGFLTQLKHSLNETIAKADWMGEETKLKAQYKLKNMLSYLATPEWASKAEDLDKAYELTGWISSENYVNAYRKMMEFYGKLKFFMLRHDISGIYQPSMINAFYAPTMNEISLLIGVLQPPLYYPSAPLSVNFGGIGFITAHEITHGFDDTGSQFNFKGEKENWWDKDTLKIYKEKLQCFIRQYSNYTEPKTGIKLNGNKTIGDDVADNGGVHIAYNAYKEYVRSKYAEKDLKLPFEMNRFTKDQLFFISAANFFCENNTKFISSLLLLLDVHSPNSAR